MTNPFEDIRKNFDAEDNLKATEKEKTRLANWKRSKDIYERYSAMVTECLSQLNTGMAWNGEVSNYSVPDPNEVFMGVKRGGYPHAIWEIKFGRSNGAGLYSYDYVYHTYYIAVISQQKVENLQVPDDRFEVEFRDVCSPLPGNPYEGYKNTEVTEDMTEQSLIKALRGGAVKFEPLIY